MVKNESFSYIHATSVKNYLIENKKEKKENGDFCYIQINFSQKQPEKEILHEFIWHLVCLYISVAGTDLYS